MNHKLTIAVVYNLPTTRAKKTAFIASDEDTKDSAEEVSEALVKKGAESQLIPVSEDTIDTLKNIRADCIFNLIEWTGLDTPLNTRAVSILESTGIPMTGSNLETIVKTSDKIKMKEALDLVKIPTPRWQMFTSATEEVRPDFIYPVIIKLGWEHCSIGLTRDAVIRNNKDLLPAIRKHLTQFRQPVYIEEFIAGGELQVTLYESHKIVMLPPAEIVFDDKFDDNFLTYEGRWVEDSAEFKKSHVAVASLSTEVLSNLTALCLKTYKDIAFRDYARFDLRLRGNEIYFLEVNSNPGLGDSDDYSMTVSYKAAGLTFADFIWKIVESCLRRSVNQRVSAYA